MVNFIFAAIIIAIVGLAVAYIVREKKRGVKCVGCPMAGTCSQHHESMDYTCSCGTGTERCQGSCHTDAS